jgi:membrane protein
MLVQIAAYGAAPALVFIFIFLGTVIAFSVLPQARIPTSALLSGAGLTALLLTVGNAAVSLYFTYGTSISAYGVAGSLVALLLWFYYSALIFLFGVSYTWILVKECITFSA